jgi:hypothetical protein
MMDSYIRVNQESHTWQLSLQLSPSEQQKSLTALCVQLVRTSGKSNDFVYITRLVQGIGNANGMSDTNETEQAAVLYEMLLYPMVFSSNWDHRGKVSEIARCVSSMLWQSHPGTDEMVPNISWVDTSKLLHLLNGMCVSSMICNGVFHLLQDLLEVWFWVCCINNLPVVTDANGDREGSACHDEMNHINIPFMNLSFPLTTGTFAPKGIHGNVPSLPLPLYEPKDVDSPMGIGESCTILPTDIIQWLSSRVTEHVAVNEPIPYMSSPSVCNRENTRITYTVDLQSDKGFAIVPSHLPVRRLRFFRSVYCTSEGAFCIPTDMYNNLHTKNLVRCVSSVTQLDNITWGETIKRCTSTIPDEQASIRSINHLSPTSDILRGIDFPFFLCTWLKNISNVSMLSMLFDMSTCETSLVDLNPKLHRKTLLSTPSTDSVSSCVVKYTDDVKDVDIGSCVINMPSVHSRCIQTACLEHYIQNVVGANHHLPYSSSGCLILVARPNKTQSWMSILHEKIGIRRLTISCPRTGTAAAEYLHTQTMSHYSNYNTGRLQGDTASKLGTVTIMDTSLLSSVPAHVWQQIHWRMVIFDGHHTYDRKDESWTRVQTIQCSTRILLSNQHAAWSTRELICGSVPLNLRRMIYSDNSILDRITLSPTQLHKRGLVHVRNEPPNRYESNGYTQTRYVQQNIRARPHLPTQDDTCCICYGAQRESVILQCTHSYCLECITKWATHNHNCPICRRTIERYVQ